MSAKPVDQLATEQGFRRHHTGGGCHALLKELDDETYILITSDGGFEPPTRRNEHCLVGWYNEAGDELQILQAPSPTVAFKLAAHPLNRAFTETRTGRVRTLPMPGLAKRLNEALRTFGEATGVQLTLHGLSTRAASFVHRPIAFNDSLVGQWIRGEAEPSLIEIRGLARALGVNECWLAFGTEQESHALPS